MFFFFFMKLDFFVFFFFFQAEDGIRDLYVTGVQTCALPICVRDGDLDVVLDIDARFADDIAEGKPGTVRIVYDRSRDRARPSIEQAEVLLRAYNREWGRARLVMRGVSPDVANPIEIDVRDLA